MQCYQQLLSETISKDKKLMITINHIKIYKKYAGDGDGLIRCATPEEKLIMDYSNWSLIDNLVQDLILIKKGIASLYFVELTKQKLIANCDDNETIIALNELV